jgi:hypothetical protein
VTLAGLHERLAVTATLFTFVMAIWALATGLRGRGIDGNYLGALVVGELLLVAEAALGVVLLVGRGVSPARGVHLLYGLLAVLIWPFLFSYTRGERGGDRREAFLYAAGSLFLWGLVLRASTTGGVG